VDEELNTRERLARLEEQVKALHGILTERDKQVGLALRSIDRATEKAEEAQQRVNQGQNEFRGALKDQSGTLATKEEVGALRDGTIHRLAALENQLVAFSARIEGRERGGQPYIAIGLAVAMIVLSGLVSAAIAYLR